MGQSKNQVAIMAERLSIEPADLQSIVINTIMPSRNGQTQVSNEQFVSFLAVANEYHLNPMIKEIYAFPAKGGGIQPIVSIDGWLKIINSHPQFNGMAYEDQMSNDGQLVAITCRMHRKDREHPVEVTEYMNECRRNTDTWRQWPARMLRHKATIQAARYAFGFSGIVDPDEAERIQEATEKDMGTAQRVEDPEFYSDASFEDNYPKWQQAVAQGKKTPDGLIAMIESKYRLSDAQKTKIRKIAEEAA